MPLYINDILWEKDSHYSHEFKLNKEKYNLNQPVNKVYYKHSLDTDENMLCLFMIGLLQSDGYLLQSNVFVNYLPFERDDKIDSKDLMLKSFWDNFNYTVLGEEHSPNRRKPEKIKLPELPDDELYVFVDRGGLNRYELPNNYICGSKKRDEDGNLMDKYELKSTLPIKYIKDNIIKFIVKDDICSLGGTFEKTYHALRKMFGEDIEIVLKVHYFEAGALEKLQNEKSQITIFDLYDNVEYKELI